MLVTWIVAAVIAAVIADQIWTLRRPIAPRLYLPSRKLGWTLRPRLKRAIELRRDGALVWGHEISINAHGFNDREWGDKPAQTRRVLVIGDSIVESRQVSRARNFVALAERQLNTASARYDVFNVGVAGWSVDSALNYFEQVGPTLSPDLVILSLFVGNDLVEGDYDTFRYLFGYAWDCRRYDKPSYSWRNGRIERGNFPAWRNVSARCLSVHAYEHSRAFRRLYQRLNKIMEKRRNGSNLLRARGISYNMYMEQTKGNAFFYTQTETQVATLADACRKAGCGFGVMLEPNFPLFYPLPPDADLDSRASQEYQRDLAHYREMHARLSPKYPLVSLFEPLQAADRQITFKPADPHLNEAGHELVAEHLTKLIQSIDGGNGV